VSTRLSLSRHRRAEVWRDECPVPGSHGAVVIERALQAGAHATPAGRVAVEASIPKGPTVMYGLLGGEFRPAAPPAAIEVRVHHGDGALGAGPAFSSDVAVRPERPVAGLVRPFAEAVVAGVEDALRDAPLLGPGVLTIDCAAHGAIGSSPVMFRALGRALVALLARSPSGEAELTTLLETALS
jgi:hypothetical protein